MTETAGSIVLKQSYFTVICQKSEIFYFISPRTKNILVFPAGSKFRVKLLIKQRQMLVACLNPRLLTLFKRC